MVEKLEGKLWCVCPQNILWPLKCVWCSSTLLVREWGHLLHCVVLGLLQCTVGPEAWKLSQGHRQWGQEAGQLVFDQSNIYLHTCSRIHGAVCSDIEFLFSPSLTWQTNKIAYRWFVTKYLQQNQPVSDGNVIFGHGMMYWKTTLGWEIWINCK